MEIINENIGITRGQVRVDFVDLYEGLEGDYDPDDPNDIHLLRFDVYKMDDDAKWVDVGDSSYCTQVPSGTSINKLYDILQIIMSEVYEPVCAGDSIKRICERLSWIDETGSY